MGELPLDIYEDILVRFKTKDLLRYKSVCKSWYSLISSDSFAKSHLNYNRKKMLDNNEIGDTRIVLSGPSVSDDKCDILGSSNGLVCVRSRNQLLVVNPSTRQVKKLESLPQFTESKSFMGFGYDSSIDDYKVVIKLFNICTRKYRFLVLTLRSNVWRSVVGELNHYLMYKGVSCNGAIHILGYDRNDNRIVVSFDLSKEIIKEFPTPLPKRSFGYYKLGTTEDRLCFFCVSSGYKRELWVLKNYNVQESESIWEPILLPPPCDDSPRQAMMDYNPRKSFSGHIHIWMLEENSSAPVFLQSVESPYGEDHHIWLSTISECNYKYDEHLFVESLVSPHGMGNDNGNGNEGRVTMEMGGDSREKKKQKLIATRHLRGKNADAKDASTRGTTKRNKKEPADGGNRELWQI